MKNSEPLKADEKGRHRKMASGRMPGPGARTFWAKTMSRLPFHGRGGPTG
jgi:hypothetical protein